MSEASDQSARLQEFQAEVDGLKLTGGKVGPERTWGTIGALLMVAGIVCALVAWLNISSSKTGAWTNDFQALGMLGLVLAVVGGALFIVMSLRRYLRFWLIRLVFEQRASTDRIVGKA